MYQKLNSAAADTVWGKLGNAFYGMNGLLNRELSSNSAPLIIQPVGIFEVVTVAISVNRSLVVWDGRKFASKEFYQRKVNGKKLQGA